MNVSGGRTGIVIGTSAIPASDDRGSRGDRRIAPGAAREERIERDRAGGEEQRIGGRQVVDLRVA